MKCNWCNKEFTPSNSRQKCCCNNCSKYAWNKRHGYDTVKATKKWRQDNPDLVKTNETQYYELNRDRLQQNSKDYYIKNKDRYQENRIKWAKENPDKLRNINRLWKSENKKYTTERAAYRYKHDINFKLRSILRARLLGAIKSSQKAGSAIADLGCSIEELKKYLESLWQPGMTWDNHSRNGWHIDHIRPLDSFDLTNPEEFKKACHYSNLQPLWAEEDLKKGAKYERSTNC